MRNLLLILPLLLMGCNSLQAIPTLTPEQIESKLQYYKDTVQAKVILLEGLTQELQKMQGPVLGAFEDKIGEIESVKAEDRDISQKAELTELKDNLRVAHILIADLEQLKKVLASGLAAAKTRLAALETLSGTE